MRKVLIATRPSGMSSVRAARVLLLSVAVVTLFGVALSGEEGQVSTSARTPKTPAETPTVDQPISVESIDVREAGAELRIRASAAPIWTQYRDLDDRLVVEMPNTTVDSSVRDLALEDGLLSSVTLQRETSSRRPLLRLVIDTREPSQHTLQKDSDTLVLRFTPTGEAPGSRRQDKEPAKASFETESRFDRSPDLGRERSRRQAKASAANAWPGTADEPYRSPPPVGIRASQLEGVEVIAQGPETAVLVVGDGAFTYKSFQLENPDRFVLDLEGVVVTPGSSSVSVDGPAVERVRMAQYRSEPQPISRVVFDLSRPVLPVISGSADGLTLRFPLAAAALPELQDVRPEPLSSDPGVASTDEELILAAVEAENEADLPTFDLAVEPAATAREVVVPEAVVPQAEPLQETELVEVFELSEPLDAFNGPEPETLELATETIEVAAAESVVAQVATPEAEISQTETLEVELAEVETLEAQPAPIELPAVETSQTGIARAEITTAAVPETATEFELPPPRREVVDEPLAAVPEPTFVVASLEPVVSDRAIADSTWEETAPRLEAPLPQIAAPAVEEAPIEEAPIEQVSVEAEPPTEVAVTAFRPSADTELEEATLEIAAEQIPPRAESEVSATAALAPSGGLETVPEVVAAPPERSTVLTQPSREVATPELIAVTSPAVAGLPPERSRAETLIAQIEPAQEPAIPEPQGRVQEEPIEEEPIEEESFTIERARPGDRRDDALVRGEGVLRPGFGTRNMSGQKQYYGEPISLSVRNADITEILRTIARISGLNMVIQPGISGGVTVELEAVPWDQALEQILKLHQLGMELDGNILRIVPISVLADEASAQIRLQQAKALSVPLSTIMRKVSYAQASEIAQILRSNRGGQGVLSQRGSVVVDNRTNTLIIQELPGNLDAVLDIVQNLDTPEEQVMIEARIVETSKSWSRSLGIQWNFSGVSSPGTGNTTGLQFPNNGSIQGGANLFTGGNNGFLNVGLGNVLNTFELDVALIAAENEGLVNVISAPKIATLNNERASIQSGLQIPIQTVANNTVTVQFVNATLRLDVTPHVTADGTILMEIQIQKREPQLAFAVIGATNAPIATREARTRVLVRDGGTTVIGGIYEVSTDDSEARVPGLANIPILGRLFKNKDRRNENEELLIFITPRVIRF